MEEKAAIKTLSFLLITIGIYLLLWQAVITRAELPVYYYGRLIELLAILLFIALALHTPMKFEDMGIVTSRKTLLRSLSLGGAVALFVLFALAAAARISHSNPLFSLHVKGDVSRATYFLVAPLQEILSKSVMYYSFELCFGKKHPFLIIFMSAVTFGIFHVVYGIRMMLLAMGLSVLTGWMFCRVRCVWGCALTHFALGFFPSCFGFS